MRTLAIGLGLGGLVLAARPAAAACADTSSCSGGPVRVMIVLDGSSAMLNAGDVPAAANASEWDQARRVLAGDVDSIYDAQVDTPLDVVLSQIAHVGVVTFGDPGQEVRVIDYAPCSRPNVEWALDPNTSCDAPGCTDPWGGPPITWTFKDGSTIDPPDFVRETNSTMPHCDGSGACAGSGRFVHRGIELATANQMAYRASTGTTHDGGTIYINILLVSDSYEGASTAAEVQAALEAGVAEGVTTYVVGFGEGVQSATQPFVDELALMAQWGGSGDARQAQTEAELRVAIRDIVGELPLPCCYSIDCSGVGGADGGGIGNDSGDDDPGDDAADGNDWGSADGDGSASADGEGSGADASASDTDGDEAGFDDDGGCRCTSGPGPIAPLWGLGIVALVRRRRR